MVAMRFYHSQFRRYLAPSGVVLVLDFLLLFVLPDFPGRRPIIAILSGSLGGFVRFLVAERIAIENLNDTTNMFRYWASLAVGAVLGFFSYLLLIDARLLKIVYPHYRRISHCAGLSFGGYVWWYRRTVCRAACYRRSKAAEAGSA